MRTDVKISLHGRKDRATRGAVMMKQTLLCNVSSHTNHSHMLKVSVEIWCSVKVCNTSDIILIVKRSMVWFHKSPQTLDVFVNFWSRRSPWASFIFNVFSAFQKWFLPVEKLVFLINNVPCALISTFQKSHSWIHQVQLKTSWHNCALNFDAVTHNKNTTALIALSKQQC